MGNIPVIGRGDVAGKLTWTRVVEAIAAGHRKPRAGLGDQFLYQGAGTLMCRAAWIPGGGIGVKSFTVMPDNAEKDLPTVHGAMLVFDNATGAVRAVIDSDVVTWWKTAADSVLGARFLARPDARTLLIVGAGTVAESLVQAYTEIFPALERIRVWNRTPARAEAFAAGLAEDGYEIGVDPDLAAGVASADIVSAATLAKDPVLKGEWVRPGTHVDLIGAFRHDMREADDALLQKARLFVDSRETTLEHIGELLIPLKSGAITRESVLGDLYDLAGGFEGRRGEDDITVFKNGGGAHLDLMTAGAILEAAGEETPA